tara:strand:+ start:2545 stop:2946 length:402 start_codon:yes stop_codon:yes gene_type:complete
MKNNSIELKIKLFRDDLEDGLRNFHGFSISIDSSKKLEKNIEYINQYIDENFSIIINDQKIKFKIENFNLINDVLEVSFFDNNYEKIDSVKVINKFLIEVYAVQSNIVFLEIEDKKYYTQFNISNTEEVLFIK